MKTPESPHFSSFNTDFSNLAHIEEIEEKYRQSPSSIEPDWQAFFEDNSTQSSVSSSSSTPVHADLLIDRLIRAYRRWGHLKANVNPIALNRETPQPWQLDLLTLGLSESLLNQPFPTNNLLPTSKAPLKEIIAALEETYCHNIGVEFMGTQNPELLEWLPKQIEPTRFGVSLSIEEKKAILQHLNKSELFEVFLHTKYVGQKRFSLEGGETLIPIIDAIMDKGTKEGIETFVIGMAHRGRLNVLTNILQKSYSEVFSEFEEGHIPLSFEGSGDVKYHKGFSSTVSIGNQEVSVILTPNPSHLEAVNPVVQGLVRAKQDLVGKGGHKGTIPILVHGDAAVSGQGVVYETLQFYDLDGYKTGGTIHIVINNQIGFTTIPKDGRSTLYCTDIARTFNAPVFHVNAEDPEGCVFATHLAMKLRQKFHCDVFIDLNCYRKYGHNEGDEPAFTQPHEYQLIRSKKPIREVYRDKLIKQGVLEKEMAEALEAEFKEALQIAKESNKSLPQNNKKDGGGQKKKESQKFFTCAKTGVEKKTLQEIADIFCTIPKGLVLHRKLEKVIEERKEMGEEKRPVDWGMAEMLAYASLLWEGKDVRISGQDSCRGTFSHRHAIWMDQEKEQGYCPLKHLKKDQGRFEIFNSPLSEYAVLGFEYGYSLAHLKALVIWEAQFGDFCNGAQVMIDQFIAAGERKWGQKNGVVLFLPHGYEGQGPEHSSARMERFLALSAEENMQVVNPTTPAQLFHLLRRQLVLSMEKPLVVFTPKGLLRHPQCLSPLEDFSKGVFQEILDDPMSPKKCEKLVFCSGRIFYDLLAERDSRKDKGMAIVRLEQYFPFHGQRVEEIIKKYQGFQECLWVQEEPKNMGGWEFAHPLIEEKLPEKKRVRYIGRKRSAATAAGSYALHKKQYQELIEELFN